MEESFSSYKVVMLGDATVGKTHFSSKYIRGTLPKSPSATVGVEFMKQIVELSNGVKVRAQIWDTAGQERYKSIVSNHFRRAAGAVLLYDITNKTSFLNAARWLEELKQYAEPDIVVMLVGNKIDLVDHNPSSRAVTVEQGQHFAATHGLLFCEASAITGHNVHKAFQDVLLEIHKQQQKNNKPQRSAAGTGMSGGGISLGGGSGGGGMVFNNNGTAKEENKCC